MPFFDSTWYCNSVGYAAVAPWAAGASIAAGQLVRQLAAPTAGNERVFVCIVAGTTGGTEPSWTVSRGAQTTDNTVHWIECTGVAGLNGDQVNTITWATLKALGGNPSGGVVIKRNNGASYQICTGAGSLGASEPAFSDTAGVTTADSSTTWTSLGPVGNFANGGAPHARLGNATQISMLPGNTIYVGDNHAETQASLLQVNPTGSQTTAGKLLCVNHAGGYPPAPTDLTTGATITTTAGSNMLIGNGSPAGTYYFNGLTFICNGTGLGIYFSSSSLVTFDHCSLQLNSGSNASINLQVDNLYVFNNTTAKFNTTGQNFQTLSGCTWIWQNTAPILVSGSAIPTNLVNSLNGPVIFEALDLSQIPTLFSNVGASVANVLVKDCKLNAALTVPAPSVIGVVEQFVRSSS